MRIKVDYRTARRLYAAGWAIYFVDAEGRYDIHELLAAPTAGYKRWARHFFGVHARDFSCVEFYAQRHF